MSILGLSDKLYILPLKDPSGIGLIEIPKSYGQQTDQGIVKYRGPDTTDDIQVGDHVLFAPQEGTEVVLEGEGALVILREHMVDCILLDSPDSRLMASGQIKKLVERVIAEVCRTLDTTDEKVIAVQLGDRIKDQIDSRFADELYF